MGKKASIIFGIIISAIIGLWLWTIFIPKNYISIGGSTSVDPIMQRLTNRYHKEHSKSKSYVYSSSGSRGGLSNMESGIYDIGFISKTIDNDLQKKVVNNGIGDKGPDINSSNSFENNRDAIYNYLINKKSEEDKLNYLMIGTDAVILVYYPTSDFAKYYSNKFIINPNSEKDQKIIFDIYQKKLTWADLAVILTGESYQQVSNKLTLKDNYRSIIPYSRETGSGTRNSFEKLFNFKTGSDIEPSKAFENNSNGMMFTGIQSSLNAFGYLSLNYLKSIKEDDNLKAVIIDDGASNYFDPLSENNFDQQNEVILENFQNYPLTRPYIGLFKTNLSDQTIKNFANFFAWMGEAKKSKSEIDAPRKIYQIEGLIPQLKFNFNIDEKKVNS